MYPRSAERHQPLTGQAGLWAAAGVTARYWAAASPSSAAAIAHVSNNDIYGNLVGIAVANGSSGCMIAGNGIDRNRYQGITVYSGSSNSLVTNTLHSNGTAKDNAYAHIDLGTNVGHVCISNNNFSPQDAGITNVASYCVYVAPGAPRVIGDLGAGDPTAAHAITNAQAGAAPWARVSHLGAAIQGSGNDILALYGGPELLPAVARWSTPPPRPSKRATSDIDLDALEGRCVVADAKRRVRP